MTCARCGECCRLRGFVRVTGEEIGRIAAFLGIADDDCIDRYTRLAGNRHGLELAERVSGECVFLDGNDCGVHPVKPLQCRTFPRLWRYPGADALCPACGPDGTGGAFPGRETA
ncbi:MAG: YkgJ family cysteine cluster protein [bacterium]|nr:YkgJ family cysteine cluster protein [bacterium]